MLGHYRPLQNEVVHQYESIQHFPKFKKPWTTGQNLYQNCARHNLLPDTTCSQIFPLGYKTTWCVNTAVLDGTVDLYVHGSVYSAFHYGL